MLTQLDTAIAFVVVMLMLSLLVTAIVQMISALMDLRGKNLVRALTSLLQQLDRSLKAPGYNVSPLSQFWHNLKNRTSEGVSRAKQLAQAVASHPTIAHSGALAKAVRQDELLDVLKDLASADTLGNISAELQKDLGAMIAGTRNFEQALMAKLEAGFPGLPVVRSALTGLTRELVESPTAAGVAATDFANNLLAKLPSSLSGLPQVQSAIAGASAQVSRVGTGIAKLETGLDKWFDTVMDRASDVFTRWTRVITVAISVLLVVILHLDAGLILHQISADPQIRAGLTKMSDAALTQADETLKNGNRGEKALDDLAAQHASDMAGLKNKIANAPKGSLVTCAQGAEFLRSNYPKVDLGPMDEEFQNACQKQTEDALKQSRDSIASLRNDLASTNLVLIPNGVSGPSVFDDTDKTCWEKFARWRHAYSDNPRHLAGTLAMVILLSLGAPFWFNALRQLSNLKPSISQKVEGEEKPDAQNNQPGGAAGNRGV